MAACSDTALLRREEGFGDGQAGVGDGEDLQGFADVFEFKGAHSGGLDIRLVLHLVVNLFRNEYAAGRRQRFDPGSDIDAVADDVLFVYDYIAAVDADPDRDLGRCPEAPLQFDPALHRVDSALENAQRPVSVIL